MHCQVKKKSLFVLASDVCCISKRLSKGGCISVARFVSGGVFSLAEIVGVAMASRTRLAPIRTEPVPFFEGTDAVNHFFSV